MEANERVRQLRGILSVKDFAEKLEVSPGTISNIESGTKNLSINIARKIATLYNVSVDWLYEGEKENLKAAEENIISQKVNTDYVSMMEKYVKVLEENSRLKEELINKTLRNDIF